MKISLIKSQLSFLLLSGSVFAAGSGEYSSDSILRELRQYLPLQHSQPSQSSMVSIQAHIGSAAISLESNLVESEDLCRPDTRLEAVAKLREIARELDQSEGQSNLIIESSAAPLRILFFKALAGIIKLDKLNALSLVLNNGDCNRLVIDELRMALSEAHHLSKLNIQAYHHVAEMVRPVLPFDDTDALLTFLQAAPQCELTISHDDKLDFLKTLESHGFNTKTQQIVTFEQENLSGELPQFHTVTITRT